MYVKRDALSDKMKHTGAKYTTKCNVKSIILFLPKEMLRVVNQTVFTLERVGEWR